LVVIWSILAPITIFGMIENWKYGIVG
jgi:hypothetical protein